MQVCVEKEIHDENQYKFAVADLPGPRVLASSIQCILTFLNTNLLYFGTSTVTKSGTCLYVCNTQMFFTVQSIQCRMCTVVCVAKLK